MPECGGIEATERIRNENGPDNQPVIIALTADAFTETKEKCLIAGMQEVLTKPISNSLLNSTLQRYGNVGTDTIIKTTSGLVK